MRFPRYFILVWMFPLACSNPRVASDIENPLKTKLDSYLATLVTDMNVAGLTAAITRNDSVIYTGAFGYRNIETKEPLTPRNVFHWASVSKTFVSTAVMQLWVQGKLDIDERLTTYLPYFRQQDPFYKDITIRHMLNHTSGIGDVADYEWDKPQYDSGALERFVKGIANDKMLFAPGQGMRYSNTAFEALGDVISKVSGMSFETYLRKNIFDPLDMRTTSFLYPEIPDSLRVSGHRLEGGQKIVTAHYPYNRRHAPSSTLNSNVIEMTHYAFAHLNRGVYNGNRILPDSIYNIWWTNSVGTGHDRQMGLSWWLDEIEGIKIVSHTGGDTGFRSIFALAPELNASVMLVSNDEALRTFDVATAIMGIMMGKEPNPSKE
jgi:CubicO group peptidase (beta-lactamase class C family)